MKIGIANAQEVDQVWPLISSRLQKAQERYASSLSSGDMWQLCRSGNAFLVVVWDDADLKGALIMQFQRWASKQVMYCMAIVGDGVSEWMPMARAFISQMAKDGGAESFVAEGRDGWAAIFPDARKLRVTYEVAI
jgi:hypothetical protein